MSTNIADNLPVVSTRVVDGGTGFWNGASCGQRVIARQLSNDPLVLWRDTYFTSSDRAGGVDLHVTRCDVPVSLSLRCLGRQLANNRQRGTRTDQASD